MKKGEEYRDGEDGGGMFDSPSSGENQHLILLENKNSVSGKLA